MSRLLARYLIYINFKVFKNINTKKINVKFIFLPVSMDFFLTNQLNKSIIIPSNEQENVY
ncbi:MAG: hypothetical protein A2057_15530 [Ignavibacteria bacterium GWA2_35_9]|nr:MAG: hypothetical protein A2057_15530 [Ignavibacteria bacterium GWA2_35_9]OGU48346.1 MAG: hypothetical protein A2000_09440 [Ignavibacteria bacterium GWB2_36_8]